MTAKQLYETVMNSKDHQVKKLLYRIKNAENPSEAITRCIEELVRGSYHRCIQEMEHDKVLEYTVFTSIKVVDYSVLRQMGAALAVVKEINRHNRSCCEYGEPYFKMYLVGLSKVTVKVKIKRRFGIFNK